MILFYHFFLLVVSNMFYKIFFKFYRAKNHCIWYNIAYDNKNFICKFAGNSSRFVLEKFFKRGSTLPGKIALKFDPEILKSLTKNYEIIVVTGTNGKTLTTALTVGL